MTTAVNIMLPVYNGMPMLMASIESIRRQSFTAWQCIVCDDGSTDGTWDYLQCLADDDRFILMRNERNMGRGFSRQRILEACTAPYICMLDAGDLMHPERLQRQYDYLESHPEIGLVSTGMTCFGTSSHLVTYQGPTCSSVMQYDGTHCCNFAPSMLRNWTRHDGRADSFFSDKLRFCEDQPFLHHYLKLHPLYYYMSEPLYYYNVFDGASKRKLRLSYLNNIRINARDGRYFKAFVYVLKFIYSLLIFPFYSIESIICKRGRMATTTEIEEFRKYSHNMATMHPYIPMEDRDFFILLRAGLWQRTDEKLSPAPDWQHILELSNQQTVQGIIADGLALIKSAYDSGAFSTPFPANKKWEAVFESFMSQTAQIVRRNHKINQVQDSLCRMLDAGNVPFKVVKGQTVGAFYPKPMLRCSGDIDILLPKESFEAAKAILVPKATSLESQNDYLVHLGMFFGDVEVELHGSLHPNLGAKIDNVIDAAQADLFDGKINYETFSATYIFLHCLQHFHWSGLGIRQIIDFAMLISANEERIDWNHVLEDVKAMGIEHEYEVFLTFAKNWLGLQSKHITVGVCAEAAALWEECKKSGNMGHNIIVQRHPNILVRAITDWKDSIRHYFKTRTVSPGLSKTMLTIKCSNYAESFQTKCRNLFSKH